MTRVYIVRHGNTFDTGDTIARVGARTDLPLSNSGHAQAVALGEHFAKIESNGFVTAYCSALQRTRQTAEAILARSAATPRLDVLELLREVDYGPDENEPEARVIARIGEAALKAWDDWAVPPPGWVVDPAELKRNWAELLATLSGQAGPVLIVTSNGVARFVLDAVTAFATKPSSIKLKTGAYGVIEANGADVRLLDWNVRP